MTSAKVTPAEPVDESPEVSSLESSWVFIDRPATIEEVKNLLAGVQVPYSGGRGPSVDGMSQGPELTPLTMDRYLPYVLPMSNKQKVKTPDPNNPQRDIESFVRQTTLYTQVAGRLAILAEVAERRGWTVDIYPEKDVSTGVPGYLRFDDRLVFRVYIEISEGSRSLGRRFGTAGGKAEGGFNAEGSNPYETVETSALGRALAQWGFGILPGSGIASVEEMRLARQNVGGARGPGRGAPPETERSKEDRRDLIASTLEWIESRRKLSNMTQEQVDAGLVTWVSNKFSIDEFLTADGAYSWDLLTDAQIALLRNTTRDAVVAARASAESDS